MDPISRRYVWDIIEEAKVGRAIVLTTHSMEEADILGDRIAIMARGRLRCIGTSNRLKQKFGAGYQVSCCRAAHRAACFVLRCPSKWKFGAGYRVSLSYHVPAGDEP